VGCLVNAGIADNPTMELLDAHIASNLSELQKTWIGVTAHEIGHLLGAPEVKKNNQKLFQAAKKKNCCMNKLSRNL
jgi:hypothetical protein